MIEAMDGFVVWIDRMSSKENRKTSVQYKIRATITP